MLLTMVLSIFLFSFKPTMQVFFILAKYSLIDIGLMTCLSFLQLFLGIIICMISLHMYFAPAHMLVGTPVAAAAAGVTSPASNTSKETAVDGKEEP